MNKKRIDKFSHIFIFIFIFIFLVNGRSFLGIYIYSFRIAELLIGFSIIFIGYTLLKVNFFKKYINLKSISFFWILVIYFLLVNYINKDALSNLYLYQSSVFIWYVSFLFVGCLIFDNVVITKKYFYFGYFGLLLQFVFNVLYYPQFLTYFFDTYSDKTQFLKGSEIAIFFIVVTFFSNRYFKKGFMVDLFVFFSSFYLPLMFFKSRAGGIAIALYFIFEVLKHRKYFIKDLKKTTILIVLSIISFTLSSFYIVDFSIEFKKAPLAVEQVVKHKYVISNTYDDEESLIFYRDNRFYSADGNLNWRFQLWQDVIFYTIDEDKFLIGHGFGEKLPMFNTPWYAGLDGSNENTHNFFINTYSKSGIIGLILLLFFYYFIFKQKKLMSNKDFLTYIVPLFIISMFDGAMENPYFGIVFYFFLSSFFTGIEFKKEIR